MLRQTIDILTNYAKAQKRVVMGNVAIARGAIEAGVNGVFSYPGTPSTEISEVFNYINSFQSKKENLQKYPLQASLKIYFEYSINEKIALEKAIAFSIGGKSALCVMKNVGMNVASDALMSIAYQTIVAPLVIIVCDDPGCHSSSNEQDSRYWGQMANVPVFNPANPGEAMDMAKQAYKLSGELRLPVIVRSTTRVSHSRSVVSYGKISGETTTAHFDRLPEHINIPARTAGAHSQLLEKLKQKNVLQLLTKNSKIILKSKNSKLGIISSGVSAEYINEILYSSKVTNKVTLLSLGFIHPFPEKEILNFLKKKFSKILILEELDPFIENAVRIIAQRNKIKTEILGKGFSELRPTGEFSIDILKKVLENFLKIKLNKNRTLNGIQQFLAKLPPRPPALCAGCPHRATFYLLKLVIPRNQSELIMCGDIGCFGLGALPPLKMIDTINHMGMSISMAQGLNEAFRSANNNKKLVAMVGDGTFFHSGLTSLVNAFYTRANILVVIFDNRTIGMTGHQSHPGASQHMPKYHEIEIAPLLKGMGIEVVENINPFNLRDSFMKFNTAMENTGVSVIISKSPCIFLPDFKEKMDKRMKITVDENLCNTCANHEDVSIACSRCYSPNNNLSRARQKLFAEVSIKGEEQLCPANICNHGFFNSIIEGDYKSAVEIVRDKMLFARTCGDICHRPCELFSKQQNVIPIKALKHFVSSFDENFKDFSKPKSRAINSQKKNKKVAVIGAGPAGLSAAYDLIQCGYKVEIVEKKNKAGGMVANAIPGFRMDKGGFNYEAMALKEMGVLFHFNKSLGKDYTLQNLSSDFDAVILAIGMGKSKTLDVIEKNIPAGKKMDALSFLKSYNENEKVISDGSVILVIGGGNSAMDAARAAKILHTSNKVIVSCIETQETMPAFAEEISHAISEGITFVHDSFVEGAEVDKQLKLNLHSYSNKEYLQTLSCDFVITSIGQTNDKNALKELENKSLDTQGRILQKEISTFNNIFIAGDLLSGNNMSVIGAIASGKKAAIAVRKLLENYKYNYEGEKALERINTQQLSASVTGINSHLNGEAEFVGKEILKYDLHQSCMKCNHCIDNFGCPAMVKVNGKIKIDDSRCTLCGLCVDVCPNNAIQWEVVKQEQAEPVVIQ